MVATFDYEMVINESHLDAFGHVNNAKYLEILEEARWAYTRKHGFGMNERLATQTGIVILEINIRFRSEIKNGDRIKIVSRFLDHNSKIGKIEQKILDQSGRESTLAVFTFALFDLEKRKIISFTPEWLKAMESES